MSKFRHFELNEFLESEVAKSRRIDNFPSFEVVEHLEELITKFLEPLRTALGLPIVIGSGFRCPALNRAVGGSDTSVHPIGYAADISCPYMAFSKFKDYVVNWVQKNNIKFDQILIETERATGKQWLHIGLYNRSGQQRGQIKVMNV
jgi:hypothetical protein